MKNLVLSSKNQKRNNLVEFIIKHKNTFVDIVAALYILLFLYTAISKSFNIRSTVVVLKKSPYLGNYALEIAWVIVISEYLAALLLFVPKYRKIGLNMSLILVTAFTSYIICMKAFVEKLPCSCGGVIAKLSWNQHLLLNLGFVLLALGAIALLKWRGTQA